MLQPPTIVVKNGFAQKNKEQLHSSTIETYPVVADTLERLMQTQISVEPDIMFRYCRVLVSSLR